jgi:hypothetical protein
LLGGTPCNVSRNILRFILSSRGRVRKNGRTSG